MVFTNTAAEVITTGNVLAAIERLQKICDLCRPLDTLHGTDVGLLTLSVSLRATRDDRNARRLTTQAIDLPPMYDTDADYASRAVQSGVCLSREVKRHPEWATAEDAAWLASVEAQHDDRKYASY